MKKLVIVIVSLLFISILLNVLLKQQNEKYQTFSQRVVYTTYQDAYESLSELCLILNDIATKEKINLNTALNFEAIYRNYFIERLNKVSMTAQYFSDNNNGIKFEKYKEIENNIREIIQSYSIPQGGDTALKDKDVQKIKSYLYVLTIIQSKVKTNLDYTSEDGDTESPNLFKNEIWLKITNDYNEISSLLTKYER